MRPLMRRDEDKRPWGLILLLILAGTAGLVSLPLQVATFRNLDSASRADVLRTQMLTESLAEQERRTAEQAQQYREDNRRLQLSICDQIEAIAAQTRLDVPPCPRVATLPAVIPSIPPASSEP